MCGLTGILTRNGEPGQAIRVMTCKLRHRGPDDIGSWYDDPAGIALGHTRLAIIDTSQAGHQPMLSDGGRYVIAFNGEIYNHLELRRDLAAAGAAPNWRGHSDTETLLAAVSHWGLAEALCRSGGMFALAVWDRQERRLQLARDRMGEKPLYFGWAKESLVFASEIKAIKAHPDFEGRISPAAVEGYLRFGYVPNPLSIWQQVYKLEAGCILSVVGTAAPMDQPLRPGEQAGGASMRRYWSLAETAERGLADQLPDDPATIAHLEEVLDRAVRRQMISDVPLGAFLSGGIDSSLIVALMQKSSGSPVRTFTVGFDEPEFDESRQAAAVARHIGTRHTEIRVTAAEARAVIPAMPDIFDEPFADASQIPTLLVSRQARADVTVALTGDGGDELFGGYDRYQQAPRMWNRFSLLPHPLRRGLASAITAVPTPWWDLLATRPGGKPSRLIGDRMHRLGRRMSSARGVDDIYRDLVSAWPGAQPLAARAERGFRSLLDDPVPAALAGDAAARMMYFDCLTYLPDDILCKVDRTSMSVGLETRAPLLDPEVIALAARLPTAMKIRDGDGKWAFRQVLHAHVPRVLVDRPKRGFFLPIGQWLRGPLRGWAEELLAPARLAEDGLLAVQPVRRVWEEHVSGRRDCTLQVWTILMFQAWAHANL